MGITALIAGGLGAVGSISSAIIGSNASQKASAAQVALGQQALAQQEALYNQGLGQQQKYFGIAQGALEPYITAGQSVLPTLKGLITPGPNQNALLSQTPGFQFQSQYGTMAAKNALAAQGLGASAGPVATAISNYNQGLAGTTWGNVVNALQGYAGLGNSAAGNLAWTAGSAGNTALEAAVGAGNAQAGTLTGIGQSQAAGILGSANAISGGLTGTTNALSNAYLLSSLNGGGGGNIYGSLSGPAWGGGNFLTDAYGGSPTNPLPGLTASDYAAKGGHTSGKGGRPIVVGEHGPELFVPDQAGTIVPYERVKKAMREKNCLSTRGLTRKLGSAA